MWIFWLDLSFASLMYLGNIKEGSNHNFKVNYKFVGREDEIPKFDLSLRDSQSSGAFDHSKSMILSNNRSNTPNKKTR